MGNSRNLILLVLAVLLIIGGVFVYGTLREPEAASTPIEAIPLATSAPTQANPTAAATQAPAAAPTVAAPTVAASTVAAPTSGRPQRC